MPKLVLAKYSVTLFPDQQPDYQEVLEATALGYIRQARSLGRQEVLAHLNYSLLKPPIDTSRRDKGEVLRRRLLVQNYTPSIEELKRAHKL